MNNGGMQYVPWLAAVQQIIYLDFDRETTSSNGELLSLESMEAGHSSLTEERINNIATALNEKYASQNVIFVTASPKRANTPPFLSTKPPPPTPKSSPPSPTKPATSGK